MGSGTDAELVQASRDGHVEAFARLVERYESLICAISFSATGDRALSEDVAQETFVAAWTSLGDLRDPSRLRSWLCQIARNLGAKARRSVGRDAANRGELEHVLRDREALPQTPLDAVLEQETERLVWAALERVPHTYREPLVLFYRDDRSTREVAQALGISEDTVNQRLSRGRKLLTETVAVFVERTLARTKPSSTVVPAVIAAVSVAGQNAARAAVSSAGSPAVATLKGIITMKGMWKLGAVAVVLLLMTAGGIVVFGKHSGASATAPSSSSSGAASPDDVSRPSSHALAKPVEGRGASEGSKQASTPSVKSSTPPAAAADEMHLAFEVENDDGTLWYKVHGGLPVCARALLRRAPTASFRLDLGFAAGKDGNRLSTVSVSDAEVGKEAAHQFERCLKSELGDVLFPAQLDEAVVSFSAAKKSESEPLDKDLFRSLPVGVGPSRGPDEAPITIVAYTDFQCLYCARALVTIDQLTDEYRGKVRVLTKLFPLKPSSRRLAQATVAAHEQGRFWEMHDLIFAFQDKDSLTDDDLTEFARQIGLDVAAFRRDLNSETVREIVESEIEEGQALGVRGTPTLFVNEHRVVGAQPVEVFRKLIEGELAAN